MAETPIYLSGLGLINALGMGKDQVWMSLAGQNGDDSQEPSSVEWGNPPVFTVDAVLPDIEPKLYRNRVNGLLQKASEELLDQLSLAKDSYGTDRIGVVLGSTDNGSEMAISSVDTCRNSGSFPDGYCLDYQSADNAASFLKQHLGLDGPKLAVSTACSSSAVALGMAAELIESGICDAVVAGGADIVSQAVYLGFNALEAVSPSLCNPMSANRNGITLGEGAAVFLVSRNDFGGEGIVLAGFGESADAHHMTAPHPEGLGAEAAMRKALDAAGLDMGVIDYLNLHGTGTELNDAMESKAVYRVFGDSVSCSSTKPFTGHTLGAAGATEAGLCWLTLSTLNTQGRLPEHRWDGKRDPELPSIPLVEPGIAGHQPKLVMSNSFAFGGNNISVILGKTS